MRLESLSDEELIGVVKAKNENFNSALGMLYTKYYNAICSFSRSILGNREDAEDNVNDVFCKAFFNNNGFDSYKEKGSFKSWILSITHNTAIDKLDKRKLKDKFLERKIEESPFSREDYFSSSENREILRKELRVMESIHSDILYMREFFDMDYNEIENFLNIPSSTCRGRYIRARDMLRTSLTEKYGEEQFLS
jgi:RNA polymerase sigma-70 factor (ECF subfamily)